MEPTRTARLHLELDLEITDAGAVQAHARSWAQDNAGDDPDTLSGMLDQAAEGAESALTMLVEPSHVVDGIPGVMAVGATMWVEGPEVGEADADPAGDFGDDFSGSTEDVVGLDGDLDEGESEEDWVHRIFAAAAKLPGLNLERLGCDPEESNPDERSRMLREATMLRGAIHWAYETVIDELLDDVSVLRASPDELEETSQISALPPLQATQYGPLFAQRFLAVAFDLGTAFTTAFEAPSCVAQELALKLVLDQVEVLAEILPNLGLAEDWRGAAEDSLFEDLDHELLYDPATDGIGSAPINARLRVVNLEFSDWFTPFAGRAVNPYAANED